MCGYLMDDTSLLLIFFICIELLGQGKLVFHGYYTTLKALKGRNSIKQLQLFIFSGKTYKSTYK